MKTIIIDSDRQKTFCQTMLSELPVDGSMTVTIKNTAVDPTAKQRRLQWLWNTEVAHSGLGQDDDKEAVHVRAKWMFCRPILLRDDSFFGLIYKKFMEVVAGKETKPELCQIFAQDYISTEKLNRKQRSEYLQEFQRFWVSKGCNLTEPSLQGLDLECYGRYKK